MRRRTFLNGAGALALSSASSFATVLVRARPQVVVIGGGFAGAAVAKHLRVHSVEQVDVTVVEPRAEFICTPMSNLVVGGVREINALTFSYRNLMQNYGVRWIRGMAVAIDSGQRVVTLADGTQLPYDRLVVSPGIDFMWEQLVGIDPTERHSVLHAWKGDAQMQQLFAQIDAMHDGERFVISIPQAPLRCPPAPYERACLVADYLQRAKNRCKVVILDANADVLAEAKQFKQVWSQRYADVIEYHPGFTTAEVHTSTGTVVSDFGDKVQGAVWKVIPPQRAGDIALQAGLANINRRWCEVEFLSFESTQAKNIHVLGDAIQIAPQMPKAAQMASQQARVCAAAIINLFNDKEPDPSPTLTSTCYSFVSGHQAMHIQSKHRYDAQERTFVSVASEFAATQPSSADADDADAWLRNLVSDCLV